MREAEIVALSRWREGDHDDDNFFDIEDMVDLPMLVVLDLFPHAQPVELIKAVVVLLNRIDRAPKLAAIRNFIEFWGPYYLYTSQSTPDGFDPDEEWAKQNFFPVDANPTAPWGPGECPVPLYIRPSLSYCYSTRLLDAYMNSHLSDLTLFAGGAYTVTESHFFANGFEWSIALLLTGWEVTDGTRDSKKHEAALSPFLKLSETYLEDSPKELEAIRRAVTERPW